MDKFLTKIFFVLVCLTSVAYGQPQLVLLKGERVLKRFYSGDDFVFRVKGSNTIRRTYINNLSDTSVVTHRDTVPFHRIDRVYFKQSKFYNTIGACLVIGGSAFFLIDQLNHGSEGLDGSVTRASATFVVLGLPMMLIKKKSQRLNHKHKLRTVKKGSPFYESDQKGFTSPFIDN